MEEQRDGAVQRSVYGFTLLKQRTAKSIGGSRGGGAGTRAPPSGSNFLHFHAVFGKNWSNSMLAPPPLGLAPPRLGNPGSATEVPLTDIQHPLTHDSEFFVVV